MKRNNFSPDSFFEEIYKTYKSPFENAETKDEIFSVSNDIKNKLKTALAIEKIPNKKSEISPELLKKVKRKNYTVLTYSAEICAGLNMLFFVLEPEGKFKSGIVAFCGHGYGCRQIIRQSKSGCYRRINFLDNYQKNFAEALAENGHLVIVPEPIGFGEAKLKKDSYKPFYSSSCDTISHHSMLYGFSTASLRVYQVQRCIDILTKKYGVETVGCMGISGGGLVSLYSACVDDRIEKVCVCGYINTFKTSVLSMWHCPDNYIPDLLSIGEIYDFACALAPKKMMMEYGKNDKLFPLKGSQLAAEKITEIYEKTGAKNNFFPVEFNGKHEVSLPEALEFFER